MLLTVFSSDCKEAFASPSRYGVVRSQAVSIHSFRRLIGPKLARNLPLLAVQRLIMPLIKGSVQEVLTGCLCDGGWQDRNVSFVDGLVDCWGRVVSSLSVAPRKAPDGSWRFREVSTQAIPVCCQCRLRLRLRLQVLATSGRPRTRTG